MMKHKENQGLLSLKSWSIVFALVGLFIFFAFPIENYIRKNMDDTHNAFNIQRLSNGEKTIKIINIGSSMTHHAFSFDNVMEEKLDEFGVDADFVRISASVAETKEFEPILTAIVKAKPDIVIIELEMLLTYIPERKEFSRSIYFVFSRFFALIKSWLGANSINPRFQPNFGDYTKCANDRYLTTDDNNLNEYAVKQQLFSPAWQEFITQVTSRGVKVILQELGSSYKIQENLTEQFKIDYEAAIKQIVKLNSVDIWRYPGPFDAENYCDFVHMNQQGKNKFQDWFVPRLKKVLDD